MNFSYDYHYSYPGGEEMMEEMMGGFGIAVLGFLGMILFLALAVGFALYVFRSIGLYSLARRRGIRNAWMAWIPVLRNWIVGCVSDQYQYVVRNRVKSKRLVLLTLTILCTALEIAGTAMSLCGVMFVPMISGLVCFVLSVVYLVFYYMAMYDLYTSCSPQNNVMFLVLSIFFRVTEPFFLFFNRRKDEGMPPRREEPHIAEPLPEPWENQ